MSSTPAYPRSDVLVLSPAARLDGRGAEALAQALAASVTPAVRHVILDMTGVAYLSSAALRVFVSAYKERKAAGGSLVLAAVPEYAHSVLEIAGFVGMLPLAASVSDALGGFATTAPQASSAEATTVSAHTAPADARVETVITEKGALFIQRGHDGPGFIEVAGDINDVLASRITPAQVFSKQFSHKAYSIGLGGLGAQPDDYFTLMGEMITIGGTMVWLPCDGSGQPDFLIPKNDSGQVLMRTGFNASLAGEFHDYVSFTSAKPEGVTMAELYRLLFEQAKQRRPEFKGALGFAMRAEMPAVFGAGVVKAPVEPNKPANGKFITDPSNFPEWFEFDKEPRHRGVTGLVAGCGIDLTCDLSGFTQEFLQKTFYYNPANKGAADLTLHNHVVAFNPQPLADGFDLEGS
ncbi:MAG TPA: STAS domain-containing protein, partial [Rariglobus sp.]|nr:STAS domain-containing protein [Rariglobus sp.]